MTEQLVVKKKLSLPSDFLSKDYTKHLFSLAKEKFENECTQENGYIVKVNKLVKIVDNYISSVDCSIMFIVDLQVEVLRPQIGKIFEDYICMVFNGGLFVNISDKIKVLIPSNLLENYRFEPNEKEFIHIKNTKLKYSQGDKIKIKINGVKYSQKQFACFGEIVS